MSVFFRFPSTAHIAWLSDEAPRSDKVLSRTEAEDFLEAEVSVEEKVDGANLGFSLDAQGTVRIQNRGQYLRAPYMGQFDRLSDWLAVHGAAISAALESHADEGLMLFGEWCAARHSLDYTALPDWFLLFDVYERTTGRFWSSGRRNALAAQCGLAAVPTLFHGHLTLTDLKEMLEKVESRYRSGKLEGVVIRKESADWCDARAKLVRSDFTQAIVEHWTRRRLEWNRVDWSAAYDQGLTG